jgi:ketosteroid isomerase-like protein
MAETGVQLARRMVERWNAGDVEGMVANCDPDVVVRLDPALRVIEGIPKGASALRRLIEDQREAMGPGQLTALEEDDFGSWGMMRVQQAIHSRSGIESEWHWTLIITVRDDVIVMIEFFLDDSAARAAVGLT